MHVPVNTYYANGVVAASADGSRHVRAVRVIVGVVEDYPVVVCKIPSVDIVSEAVAVVVHAVVRNFARIYEDIIGEVAMADVNTSIDDADYDAMAARRRVPRGFSADSCSARRRVFKGPQIGVVRVVGYNVRVTDIVWFDIEDIVPNS